MSQDKENHNGAGTGGLGSGYTDLVISEKIEWMEGSNLVSREGR